MYKLICNWKQLLRKGGNKGVFRSAIITISLSLFLTTFVSAKIVAQKISVNLERVSLVEVFETISKQSSFKFLYDESSLSNMKNITVKVNDGTIESVLDKVLSRDYSYKIIANTVTINHSKRISESQLAGVASEIQTQKFIIKGVIKNESGVALTGATVSVKGTTNSVITNQNGEFEIEGTSNATLVVSFLGHEKQELSVNNRNVINITLKELFSEIEGVDVVATGYQKLDRKFFTGSTSKVTAEDSERSGVPDITRMLEGQAAGVSIQNVSGTFGAAPKVRVRGATSLSGDNKPLWVIDGIILEDVVNISNEELSTGDANTLLGSSVAGINPDDIESFTILKDAAATAMYGARAMNGVIVVTTKSGVNTEGQARLNYSGTFTTYLKPDYNQFDIMNSAEQMSVLMEMENKGYFSHAAMSNVSNGGVFTKMYDMMYDYDEATDSFALKNTLDERLNFLGRYAEANTNWFDVLFKNSLLQEHSLNATVGTDKAQTYVSTSFTSDNGQTLGDRVRRYTGNLRENINISDKVKFELLINGSIRDQRAPGTLTRQSDPVYGSYSRDFDINPYSYALNTSRLMTPYTTDGELEYFTRSYAPFNIINELNTNYMDLKSIDLKVQGGLTYRIIPQVTYSVDAAYRYGMTERNHYIESGSNMASAFRANPNTVVNNNNKFLYDDPDFPNDPSLVILPEGGFFNVNNNSLKNYYFRQNIEFNESFNTIHKVNFFGSMEMRYTDRNRSNFEGVGYQYENGGLVNPNYRFFKKMTEAGDPYFGMDYGKDRSVAFMGRGAYNLLDRYSFNATVRYDGSNRMGLSRSVRWLPTWNLSGAWNLDQEPFYPENQYLSSARIRGTYGLVANMGNANNSTALFYNRTAYRPYENEKETMVYISSLENSELTWEKLYEFNVGGDFGVYNDKINVTFDYYKRDIFDLLGNLKTSGVGGEKIKYANYGKMKSHGVELTVAGNPISNTDGFKWRTQFNFAINKNTVTELEVNPNIWTLVRPEGAPMKGYSQRGLFSLAFDGLDSQYGYPTFVGTDGTNGEPYIYLQNTTDVDHLVYEGPVDPIFTGGFYNRFSYKGFTLSALLTFAQGNAVRLQPTISSSYSDMNSMTKDMVNRWLFPGDENITNIPSIIDEFTNSNNILRPNGTTTSARYPYNAYNYSDRRVARGDFIRLKNISITYQLPQHWISSLNLSSAQIALVGNNIALLYSDKRLNGADPEFFNNGGVAMPIPKQYTLSLKLGL